MQHLTIQMKLYISFLASIFFSSILSLFQYYHNVLIKNTTFLIVIFSVFIVDIGLGALKHLKLKDFSFRELLTKAMLKLCIGFASMVVFNSFASVMEQDAELIKTYFTMVGKLLTLTYYAGSAFNSMSVLTAGKFPPIAWMTRMKEFNNTLNIKTLTNDKE